MKQTKTFWRGCTLDLRNYWRNQELEKGDEMWRKEKRGGQSGDKNWESERVGGERLRVGIASEKKTSTAKGRENLLINRRWKEREPHES